MSPRARTRAGTWWSSRRESPGVTAVPTDLEPVAELLFGDRFPLALRFAEHLATTGTERGLIGPREVPRLWERHLLNCAVVAELVPPGSLVADVGSGAGLPGLVLAIARPDLRMTLVEPLLRRTVWLGEVVDDLGLDTVTVYRGRAEEWPGPRFPVVTARAVAELGRLWGWCGPMLEADGRLLALKGESAEEELATVRDELPGLERASVHRCGQGRLEPATVVVELIRDGSPWPRSRSGRRPRDAGAVGRRSRSRR